MNSYTVTYKRKKKLHPPRQRQGQGQAQRNPQYIKIWNQLTAEEREEHEWSFKRFCEHMERYYES